MADPLEMPVIRQRVLSFLNQEILNSIEGSGCSEEDELLLSGVVDSISIMRLVGFIEEEFEVAVSPEDVTIERFRSVATIADFVAGRRLPGS
jgi:acyl carrier protein